jgi:4-amino-4-deoxy-L-arabinose transferase-like glycosyltransferase
LLLAVWPNLILLSGLASKELLVLFLLSLAVLIYLKATDRNGRSHWSILAAGLAFGGAALTQPNTLVLLPAFAACELLRGTPIRGLLSRMGLLVAGTALVVSPWTIRNYCLFHKLVPISANFGHSLFVGNHAGADGGFQPIRDAYRGMDEIEYERMARQQAWAWIRANPRAFFLLVPRKQMLFLGDDADGAYHALKWAYGISDVRYVAAKGASNVFWLGIVALVGISLREWRRHGRDSDPRIALFMLFWFCLLALLSVTESGARHHIALSGAAALCASLAAASQRPADPVLLPTNGPRHE